MILVLIGPHGAGKSTLGQVLAARLGVPFHGELGRSLALDPAWRPPGGTAADPALAFDQELFARELARDLGARGPRGAHRPRIVETWHPGNLAYATRRSPQVVAAWLPALARACRHADAVVLPLDAPRPVLARRQSEPGDLDFFREVGAAALGWAQALGLACLPTLQTDLDSPELLAGLVLGRLGGALHSPTDPRRPTCEWS